MSNFLGSYRKMMMNLTIKNPMKNQLIIDFTPSTQRHIQNVKEILKT